MEATEITPKSYDNKVKPNWCPGCGDFGIQTCISQAAARLKIAPHKLMIVSGIGCSSRIGGYFYCYGAHTTHGRALPFAQGIKLANDDLTVLVCSGDGDAYAIGMGHTVHALKRNVNITYIVFDNHIYGLTKGQTSPVSDLGFVTKTSPLGNVEMPISALDIAIASGATFVGQSYSMKQAELIDLIVQAVQHEGFSFLNVFTPCVTYNKRNTYEWFRDNLSEVNDIPDYDPHNKIMALNAIDESDGLITGLIYKEETKKDFATAMNFVKEPLINRIDKPKAKVFDNLTEGFK